MLENTNIKQNTLSSKIEPCKTFILGNPTTGIDFTADAIEFSKKTESLNKLLPQKGKLYVTMKDGTIGIIDLSQVKDFNVVP